MCTSWAATPAALACPRWRSRGSMPTGEERPGILPRRSRKDAVRPRSPRTATRYMYWAAWVRRVRSPAWRWQFKWSRAGSDIALLNDDAGSGPADIGITTRHAVRHHLEPEVVRESDGGTHDHRVFVVFGHIQYEGLVDLEFVHRQALEVGQRRIAGAEIIDGDAHAEAAQLLQHPHCMLRIGHHRAFGDFEFQPLGLGAAAVDHVQQLLGQIFIK